MASSSIRAERERRQPHQLCWVKQSPSPSDGARVLKSAAKLCEIITLIKTFSNSPYSLHQPFEPAGDQPEAIAHLVEGIRDGLSFQTLLGVTGSGKTFTMANVIAQIGRPAIVFAPNKTLAAQLYSEFRELFPQKAVEALCMCSAV